MELPRPVLAVRNAIRSIVADIQWLPPLLARLVLGVLCVHAGWSKLVAARGSAWVSSAELICGALMIAGLLTRLAGVAILVDMAALMARLFEYDEAAYAVMALWLAVRGAGKASLDYLIGKRLGLLVDGRDRDRAQ